MPARIARLSKKQKKQRKDRKPPPDYNLGELFLFFVVIPAAYIVVHTLFFEEKEPAPAAPSQADAPPMPSPEAGSEGLVQAPAPGSAPSGTPGWVPEPSDHVGLNSDTDLCPPLLSRAELADSLDSLLHWEPKASKDSYSPDDWDFSPTGPDLWPTPKILRGGVFPEPYWGLEDMAQHPTNTPLGWSSSKGTPPSLLMDSMAFIFPPVEVSLCSLCPVALASGLLALLVLLARVLSSHTGRTPPSASTHTAAEAWGSEGQAGRPLIRLLITLTRAVQVGLLLALMAPTFLFWYAPQLSTWCLGALHWSPYGLYATQLALSKRLLWVSVPILASSAWRWGKLCSPCSPRAAFGLFAAAAPALAFVSAWVLKEYAGCQATAEGLRLAHVASCSSFSVFLPSIRGGLLLPERPWYVAALAGSMGTRAAYTKCSYALNFFNIDPNVGRLRTYTAHAALAQGQAAEPSRMWDFVVNLDAHSLGYGAMIAALQRLYLPTPTTPPADWVADSAVAVLEARKLGGCGYHALANVQIADLGEAVQPHQEHAWGGRCSCLSEIVETQRYRQRICALANTAPEDIVPTGLTPSAGWPFYDYIWEPIYGYSIVASTAFVLLAYIYTRGVLEYGSVPMGLFSLFHGVFRGAVEDRRDLALANAALRDDLVSTMVGGDVTSLNYDKLLSAHPHLKACESFVARPASPAHSAAELWDAYFSLSEAEIVAVTDWAWLLALAAIVGGTALVLILLKLARSLARLRHK